MAFNEFEQDSSKLFLAAVNILLQTIGEVPIETEQEIDDILEASIAASILVETKKEVLADDWEFNRDKEFTMPIDYSGHIAIPVNVLDISSRDGDLIMRDWKLYSKKNQSAVFDKEQVVDIVWDLPFNSLTHPIRNYITTRAARKFQARQIMDANVYGFTEKDEMAARVIARRSDDRIQPNDIYTSPYGAAYLVDGTL